MPYSIGADGRLPLIQGDANSALQTLGNAYQSMNSGLDKLAAIPFSIKNQIQDDADARYSEALNRYSNDPEGLAKALANGEIDTSNVRAETLNQTQARMKDISTNKSLNYLQNRTENANKWWDSNGKAYLNASNDAHLGKDITDFYNSLQGTPAEALEALAKLDPVKQQNWKTDYELRRRATELQGQALNLETQKYQDLLNGQKAMFEFNRVAQATGLLNDPSKRQNFYRALISGNRYEDPGLNISLDTKPLLEAILKSPSALNDLNALVGFNGYGQGQAGYNYTDDSTALKQADKAKSSLLPKEAQLFMGNQEGK